MAYLKEAVEKTAEFENSDILVKEVNLSVLLVLSKDSSATDIILRGDTEEVVEKNAEFENSEHLNGRKQISSVLIV